MALITRWHIYRPGHVVMNGRLGERLREAYEEAGAPSMQNAPRFQRELIGAVLKKMKIIKGLENAEDVIAPQWVTNPASPRINPRRYQLPTPLRMLKAEPNTFLLYDFHEFDRSI
jgi:hypothetical protein